MVALPAWAVVSLAVASAAATAVGAISAGNAQARAAGDNARNLERTAQMEQEQGNIAYQEQLRKGQIARGQTLSALAGSGIDPGEGTPLELLGEQAKRNEFDAANVKFAHDQRAWSLRVQENQQWQAAQAAGNQAFGKVVGGVIQAGVMAGASGAFSGAADPLAGVTNVSNPAGDYTFASLKAADPRGMAGIE